MKTFNELTSLELYDILKKRSEIFALEQKSAYQDVDGIDLEAMHLFKKTGNDIQAYLRLYETKEGAMSFGRVLVPEKLRGKGLARELLKQGLYYLNENYTEKDVIIQAEEYLESFYSSLGFEVVSERYQDVGIWHVEMKLNK